MTAYLCVGGPLHGQMYEHPGFESEFMLETLPPVRINYVPARICAPVLPQLHTYRRCAIGPNCIVWLHSSIPATL